MSKVSRKLLLGILMICVLVQAPFFVTATIKPTVKKPIVVKLGFTDPPTCKVGGKEINSPCWEGMLAFKSALEDYSQGKVKVELYSNGRLGDNKSTLEQVLNGNLLVTTTVDGVLPPFYKQIQVFSAPYVFKDMRSLWKVLDGSFGRKLFNDMAAKSGFRTLAAFNTGSFRCFGNNKREIKVPADMKGLKMRVQDSPIFMELVKACGASPVPVAWMELYSALQTGVVDGYEHVPLSLLTMSFYEVLKYYTLDNHTICLQLFVTNEKFFKSLPVGLRKAFVKAGQKASIAGRKRSSDVDSLALEAIKKKGMNIYEPTSAERKLWEKTRKPALKWLRANVGSKWVNGLLKAVKK